MKYIVKKTDKLFELDGQWNKEFWQKAETIELKNYAGDKPEHFPKTLVKLLYDEKFIYVIFSVKDKYVKAVAENLNDSVCLDSCVEFFFTPNADISSGYFNIEINCIGTMLLFHQTGRGENEKIIKASDAEQVKRYASLDGPIKQEITEPVDWMIEYCVPVDILKKYSRVENPAPGVIWRANLYKCADKTSHPHWLTWSPITLPIPDFHQPKFFGTLEFE